VREGVADIFDDQPLRIAHLCIVITRAADELVRIEPRHVGEQRLASE
jgi:hypothetical protein